MPEPAENESEDVLRVDARRRRLGIALVVLAGLLAIGAVVGARISPSYVWLMRIGSHPVVFGMLAALALAAGSWFLLDRSRLRTVVVAGCLVLAVGWALFGSLWSGVGSRQVLVAAAPAGAGARYEGVVTFTSGGSDGPAWHVSIHQDQGLHSRIWRVGCISGASNHFEVRGLRWLDRTHLVLELRSGSATVTVDAVDGHPTARDGAAWLTCTEDPPTGLE